MPIIAAERERSRKYYNTRTDSGRGIKLRRRENETSERASNIRIPSATINLKPPRACSFSGGENAKKVFNPAAAQPSQSQAAPANAV